MKKLILSYERALELDPNYKDALNGKGDALFNQREPHRR